MLYPNVTTLNLNKSKFKPVTCPSNSNAIYAQKDSEFLEQWEIADAVLASFCQTINWRQELKTMSKSQLLLLKRHPIARLHCLLGNDGKEKIWSCISTAIVIIQKIKRYTAQSNKMQMFRKDNFNMSLEQYIGVFLRISVIKLYDLDLTLMVESVFWVLYTNG